VQNVLEGRPARGKGSRSGNTGSTLRIRAPRQSGSESRGEASGMEIDDVGVQREVTGAGRDDDDGEGDNAPPPRRRKPIPSAQAGLLTFTHIGKEHASSEPDRRKR
jgi:hypothetical protein